MLSLLALTLLAMTLIPGSAHAATRSKTLRIVNSQLSPDGFKRSTVVANGQYPAPLITGNMGDRFQLNVVDKLTDPTMRRATSIHWHGFFQAGTNEMDGPSFVNQCPIVPNHSFLYDFRTPGQSGTYWYHSHLSTQYCDGLRGPLVVYDPRDPHRHLYDVDDESTVITLTDWYHSVSTVLFPGTAKAVPTPDSTLINGAGRYAGGPAVPLTVVNVRHGKRYRFRVVSMSCFPSFRFSIDGHRLTVIETDGVETQPLVVDSFDIFAGQRYSVILNANQTVGNYWIRAQPSAGNTGFDGGLNSAILRYRGAPHVDPNTTQNIGELLSEANVVPLVRPGAPGVPTPGAADVNLNLRVGRDAASHNLTINGVAFIPPTVPVLLQILSGSVSPGSIMPNGSVYSLPPNQVVEVSIPGGFPHPFHLHGHNFDVVRVAGSSTYNFANPIRRDVVSIGAGSDNVTFRFVTDNPGPWFLHCHIDWHLEAGLAIVFAEDAPDTAKANHVNAAWENLCPLYDKFNPDSSLQ